MRTFVIFLAILAFTLCQAVGAQTAIGVAPGDRVRVTAPECGLRNRTSEFRGVARDSLLLRYGREDRTCQVTAVDRFEVLRSGPNWGGMASGALLGAVVGGGAGGLAGGEAGGEVGALVGGLVGAGIGKGPRARRAMLIGTGIGVVGGLLLVAITCEKDCQLGIVVVPPAPILISTVIGLMLRESRWEEVPLPLGQFSIHGTPQGQLGLGLSIPLGK